MAATSKRLEFLQKLTSSPGPSGADPFAWYGLAMELRSLERFDEALTTFEALRQKSPEYVAMYLMCGQMLEKLGRIDEARAWMTSGLEAAQRKGDSHAASELEAALGAMG
jgi:tetratricopeptide (TPR) repeat protein